MKLRNIVLLIIIISMMILWLAPTQVFALTLYAPKYNPINMSIASILGCLVPISIIVYIICAIKYAIKSKDDKKEKIKQTIKWLIVTVAITGMLILGKSLVIKLGITSYSSPFSNQRVFQPTKFASVVAQAMRILALGAILADIIFSIIYLIRSKKEKSQKAKNIVKWLIMTVISIVILLYIAPIVEEIGGTYVTRSFGI